MRFAEAVRGKVGIRSAECQQAQLGRNRRRLALLWNTARDSVGMKFDPRVNITLRSRLGRSLALPEQASSSAEHR